MPALAMSQSFLPPTFKAEYIGGICFDGPMKERIASLNSSIVMLTSFSSMTCPLISWVSVVMPSFISATYSFGMSHSFVADPMHTGSTPVASGSRVPVCPIFLIFVMPLSFATTSKEV